MKCMHHRSVKYQKVYLAFFVCFAIKAVHIEVMSDLSTESFFAAFDRFVARRGLPLTMSSDNATNFVGFANIISNNQLQEYATKRQFKWKFITARSPHMGGLWEAAIKARKTILLKAIGGQVFSVEELQTVVAKVEAILNLRPLCKASSEEDQYLTPGHFLVALLELPNMDNNYEISLTKRYCLLRQIVRTFCMSWKRSYLNQLHDFPPIICFFLSIYFPLNLI